MQYVQYHVFVGTVTINPLVMPFGSQMGSTLDPIDPFHLNLFFFSAAHSPPGQVDRPGTMAPIGSNVGGEM